MNKRRCGLKAQSLFALLISLIAAILTFCAIDIGSSAFLEHYFERSTYISQKTSRFMDRFEAFVTENNIAATDSTSIDSWINSHKTVTTMLYINRNDEIIYDSLRFDWQSGLSSANDLTGQETLQQEEYIGGNYSDNNWFLKRMILFSDGLATVSLYGYFDQWIYNIALIVETVLSCAVLCFVFILLVRRKINYVIQLEQEIKVLETGGLNFSISVKGNDELSSLAESLNQMRIALLENIQTEGAAVKANNALVVAVSHDLRTPLTSLALYLDLIHAGKYDSQDQLSGYIEKSRNKVSQIKQMTDQLFQRFYLEKETEKKLEKPELVQNILEDYLSNMTGYLEENGFKVEIGVLWPVKKISLSTDYTERILDNICSNILKYADPSFPISLKVGEQNGMLFLQFMNHIWHLEVKSDSTEIGVKNIHFMMAKMGGKCEVSQLKNIYSIRLLFPFYNGTGAADGHKPKTKGVENKS